MPMPEFDRRRFGLAALAAAGALALPRAAFAAPELRPMTGDVVPISAAERLARVARAQGLMRRLGFGSILIEPGASLTYFTGVNWHRSERLTAALIPAEGEAVIVTPFFEEPSVRESLAIPAEVRTWQE
ncbi:MAG: Xaa-Pro dipeptidase, partial [Sphingomonadales bacterium]|nr:Xaa-Pro dipeptidase [Sphingomonadales bacterium]